MRGSTKVGDPGGEVVGSCWVGCVVSKRRVCLFIEDDGAMLESGEWRMICGWGKKTRLTWGSKSTKETERFVKEKKRDEMRELLLIGSANWRKAMDEQDGEGGR